MLFGVLLVFAFSCKNDDEAIVGCTDPTSDNYDATATVDDGSCVYDDASFNAADGINGGRLYDTFWAGETTFESPADPSVKIEDITDFSNFYRCKQCHGWDQLGRQGAYVGRTPKTSRPSVANGIRGFVATSTNRELFDALKNDGGAAVDPARTADGTNDALGGNLHPDYGKILSDAEIWDLAKFLKTEAFDVSQIYDFTVTGTYPTGSISFSNWGKGGTAANGLAMYNQSCGFDVCHGTDGTGPILAEGKTVGDFVRSKSNEAHHKIKYGQLGSPMLGVSDMTIDDMKDLYTALGDTLAFPN
jgi:mono/diheme cytochrome c family protein